MKKLSVVLLVLIFVLLAFPASVVSQSGGSWERSTPEEQGIRSSQLATMTLLIENQDYLVHSLLMIRHGKIVLDANIAPYQAGMKHRLDATTTSIMTTLIGVAIDKGYIDSVDVPMMSFFQDREIANLDEAKQVITIHQLLSQTSGFPGTFESPGQEQYWDASDKLQASLDFEIVNQSQFQWSEANMTILSAILNKATGTTTSEFANEYLFGPLGIEDVTWETDEAGNYIGGSGLWLSSYDLAAIGQLFLNNGQWNGEQIVSEDWISLATATLQVDFGDGWGYGYGWIISPNHYLAPWVVRQQLHIFPDADAVLIMLSARIWDIGPFIDIIDFSDEPLPANDEALQLLNDSIDALENPEPAEIDPFSDLILDISGKTFAIEENDRDLETIRFDFEADAVGVTMEIAGQTFELTPHLDSVLVPVQESLFPHTRSQYWASTIWRDTENRFILLMTTADDAVTYDIRVRVEEDGTIKLTVYESETFLVNLEGIPVD